MKKGIGINVYEATKQRISWTFDNFERIYVSFSGGKDSTVMLHMVMQEAIKRNKVVGVILIDLEGQYDITINHALTMKEMYKENSKWFWICLPIHLRNAVSVYEPFWKCWDIDQKDIWIRQMPKDCINDINYFPFFRDGMEFEEFVPLFGEWYSQGKTTANFVGIRSDESLNRYRTIANSRKETKDSKMYTTRASEHVYNVYPIYDWKVSDIWIYQGKNKDKPYNKLYDYMHEAGLKLSQMRICQPYGDDQRRGLWLFHLIEPNTWGKVVKRVNGANSGALYINEIGNINGYNKISKPKGHTWKSYYELLINSMPPKTKKHYQYQIDKYIKYWEDNCYHDGIPDEADYYIEKKKDIPSYRKICKSILRNDYWLRGLGFSPKSSEAYMQYKRETNGSDPRMKLF